jgi:F0F1-type ATP synthase gamma subunit
MQQIKKENEMRLFLREQLYSTKIRKTDETYMYYNETKNHIFYDKKGKTLFSLNTNKKGEHYFSVKYSIHRNHEKIYGLSYAEFLPIIRDEVENFLGIKPVIVWCELSGTYNLGWK